MRIVFMGTPEFADASLKRLIKDAHDVCAVFTQPDKPKGRGHHLAMSPVKETALDNNIPVYQPQRLKNSDSCEIIKKLNPELIVVVAYGQILPADILSIPKYGCVNIHASLLPKHRGAAPIQWSVLLGDEKTGVTSMQMDTGLDTGDMLIKKELTIDPDETSGELHDRLAVLGAEVLAETIERISDGTLTPQKQNDGESDYAPMLSKEMCPIDWNLSAKEVHNKVRGLSPWPCATAKLGDKVIKIHKTALAGECNAKPGEVIKSGEKLVVACGESDSVEIIQLQAPGKKAMNAADFLRGNPIKAGEFFN